MNIDVNTLFIFMLDFLFMYFTEFINNLQRMFPVNFISSNCFEFADRIEAIRKFDICFINEGFIFGWLSFKERRSSSSDCCWFRRGLSIYVKIVDEKILLHFFLIDSWYLKGWKIVTESVQRGSLFLSSILILTILLLLLTNYPTIK